MNESEQKIKEQRTIEATKKNYMGFNGKFGMIMLNLGQEIISYSEGGSSLNSNYLNLETYSSDLDAFMAGTPHDLLNSIPIDDLGDSMEPDTKEWTQKSESLYNSYSSFSVGWHFCGLSRGIHMELTYKEEEESSLTVTYKGYEVYKEISGDLKTFVPGEWENHVDKLYDLSKKLEKKNRKENAEAIIEKAEKKRQSLLRRLWTRWGV